MKLLEKTEFNAYSWLNFESLPDSHGYKFELYPKSELNIDGFVILFYSIFEKFIDELQIGQFGRNNKWGDFCIDTWDLHNDRCDYSLEGKSKSTSTYLNMLTANEIEPEYTGFCKSLNWNRFLPIILDCIFNHIAPYSIMIYAPNCQLVFYFHHTGSIGVYYSDLNDGVMHVIDKAKIEDLEIKNINDERVLAALK
ncbi:hypothetical protein ACFQ1M_16010 [Sungkyunkwania multivorans]|uniref:DUF3885 domain-containing protein n=1 Tax=Sungkyunkwania multivorans TaxID=1173618 RepID=A0ABW3D0X9_9FLAO